MLSLRAGFGCLSAALLCVVAGCATEHPIASTEADAKPTPYLDILSSSVGPWPELTALRLRGLDGDSGEAKANRVAAQALEQRLTLNNDNLSLDQVISFIRDTTGANIAVNWPALEMVGIDQDSIVSLSLSRVTARQLLQLTLDQVSADAFEDDKAGLVIRSGIVMVSTLRDLKSATVQRQYSLDEYANTRPSVNKRIYGQNNAARRMLGMTTLQNKLIDPNTIKVKDLNPSFCANCDKRHDRLEVALSVMTYHETIEQIVDLIQTTVGDPDEWLDTESTLTETNGILFVKTTEENHAQIRRLFDSMRIDRALRFKRQALEMEVFLLLEAAEAFRLEQEYRPALDKINQALRVDPENPEAQALKDIIEATLAR